MEATTAAGIQDQFLTLLTAQLRHQDPLEPTKQEDFIAQLAQFSTLEGIEKLNQNFSDFAKQQAESQNSNSHVFQQLASAADIVGSEVTFTQLDRKSGIYLKKTDLVEAVVLHNDAVHLRMENQEQLIPTDSLLGIRPPTVTEE